MNSLAILAIIVPTIVGFGVILDEKLASASLKKSAAEALLSIRTQKFTSYVASNALEIYCRIFSKKFLSRRFLIRSTIFTTISSIIAFAFIYWLYPAVFYNATSYLRSYSDTQYFEISILLPVILFIFFDWLCNGQTKYFLSILEPSPSIGKFFVIAYSDLVVTLSIGIFSITLSMAVYFSFFFSSAIDDVRLTLDFEYSEDTETAQESTSPGKEASLKHTYSFTQTLHSRDKDLKILEKDKRLTQQFPELVSGVKAKYVQDENGISILEYRDNSGSLITSSKIDHPYEARYRLPTKGELHSREAFCQRLSNAHLDPLFRFEILSGWHPVEVGNACIKGEKITVNSSIKVRNSLLNYGVISAKNAGRLVRITLSTFSEQKMYYFSRNPYEVFLDSESWNRGYYVGDDKVVEYALNEVFKDAWNLRFGTGRVLESAGFPWSTFFIVTLLTSAFIWIVVLFLSLTYPLIWIAEKLAQHRPNFEMANHPFLTIALLISIYIAVVFILIN